MMRCIHLKRCPHSSCSYPCTTFVRFVGECSILKTASLMIILLFSTITIKLEYQLNLPLDNIYADIWKENFKHFPEHLAESDEEYSSVYKFSYWF